MQLLTEEEGLTTWINAKKHLPTETLLLLTKRYLKIM